MMSFTSVYKVLKPYLNTPEPPNFDISHANLQCLNEILWTKAHSEPRQISKVELFAKIVNSSKPITKCTFDVEIVKNAINY